MKKIMLFGVIIFLLFFLSYCGIYKEPCEGVVSSNIAQANL